VDRRRVGAADRGRRGRRDTRGHGGRGFHVRRRQSGGPGGLRRQRGRAGGGRGLRYGAAAGPAGRSRAARRIATNSRSSGLVLGLRRAVGGPGRLRTTPASRQRLSCHKRGRWRRLSAPFHRSEAYALKTLGDLSAHPDQLDAGRDEIYYGEAMAIYGKAMAIAQGLGMRPPRRPLSPRPRQALPPHGQVRAGPGASRHRDGDVPRDGHDILAGAGRIGAQGVEMKCPRCHTLSRCSLELLLVACGRSLFGRNACENRGEADAPAG
jgi:hypothetical protein